MWLITGSVFERGADGKLYNTASVIDPKGQVVARYRKMFPFLPYEHGIEPGREFCVFDVPRSGRFGLSICFDMWFPETSRTLTSMGAEVLLHPVLTGTIDRDVELAMARATAAQFQSYVFDINGLLAGGVGRSCVVDPTGTVIHQAAAGEEIIPVEIDLQQVRRQREIRHAAAGPDAQELPRPGRRLHRLRPPFGRRRLPAHARAAGDAGAARRAGRPAQPADGRRHRRHAGDRIPSIPVTDRPAIARTHDPIGDAGGPPDRPRPPSETTREGDPP